MSMGQKTNNSIDLRHLTIEEVYELSESIQNQNYDEIKKNWVIYFYT